MGAIKRLGKSERLRALLCWLASMYIRLVWVTGRWQVVDAHVPARFWDHGTPFILAFWHGRLLMMPKSWRAGYPINMLISQHRDGQLIARTVAHFGIRTIEGSSTRGGTQALRAILRSLKTGECVGITPDGPRGPRMRDSSAMVDIARLSGCPIIPVCHAARPARILGSWDRFLIARPFARGVIMWGQPIHVPKTATAADLARIKGETEAAMNDLAAHADRYLGLEPIQPEEMPPC